MAQLKATAGVVGGQEPVALPPLREDLRLYPGPASRDGSPTWRILDPIRNSFFELGWLEFELLARWAETPDAEALAARVAAEAPLKPSAEEVTELVDFLAGNQLLAPGSEMARAQLTKRIKGSQDRS